METNWTKTVDWYENHTGHYISKWPLPVDTNVLALLNSLYTIEAELSDNDVLLTWSDHNEQERNLVVHASLGTLENTTKLKVYAEPIDGERDLDRTEAINLEDALRAAWMAEIEDELGLDYEFKSANDDQLVFESHGVLLTVPAGGVLPLGNERWVYHPPSSDTPDYLLNDSESTLRFSSASYYHPSDDYGDIVTNGESIARSYDYAHHIPETYRA